MSWHLTCVLSVPCGLARFTSLSLQGSFDFQVRAEFGVSGCRPLARTSTTRTAAVPQATFRPLAFSWGTCPPEERQWGTQIQSPSLRQKHIQTQDETSPTLASVEVILVTLPSFASCPQTRWCLKAYIAMRCPLHLILQILLFVAVLPQ